MSKLTLETQGEPVTPPSGSVTFWPDSASKKIKSKDDEGNVVVLGGKKYDSVGSNIEMHAVLNQLWNICGLMSVSFDGMERYFKEMGLYLGENGQISSIFPDLKDIYGGLTMIYTYELKSSSPIAQMFPVLENIYGGVQAYGYFWENGSVIFTKLKLICALGQSYDVTQLFIMNFEHASTTEISFPHLGKISCRNSISISIKNNTYVESITAPVFTEFEITEGTASGNMDVLIENMTALANTDFLISVVNADITKGVAWDAGYGMIVWIKGATSITPTEWQRFFSEVENSWTANKKIMIESQNLGAVDLGAAEHIMDVTIFTSTVTAFTASNLKTIAVDLYFDSLTADELLSVDISYLESVNNIYISGQSNLTTVSVRVAGLACPYIYFSGNALNQASVDSILEAANNGGLENGYLNVNGGTSSAPTDGTDNTDYIDLVGKGWTVLINS